MATAFVPLTEQTIPTFVELYEAVFNAPPWNDGWETSAVLERLTSFAQHPKFQGLGVQEAGRPIALVLGWGERWTQGWHFHIKEMCIAPQKQRTGLGTKLLAEFEGQLVLAGNSGVFLETGQSAPAKQFYECNGYRNLSLVSMGKRFQASPVC